jgi:hypothetical protein
LSFSTVLTLLIIPVVYEWTDRRVTVADRAVGRSAKREPEAWQGAD